MTKNTRYATLCSLVACLIIVSLWLYTRVPDSPATLVLATPESSAAGEKKQNSSKPSDVPSRQVLEIGLSRSGRVISATLKGGAKRYVVVLAGIHGDEAASVVLAEALASSLESDPIPSNITVVIVPRLNPDGLISGTRVNANGVDLNRNFPTKSWTPDASGKRYYPGKEPASEPETQAIISLIERFPPELLISIHVPLGCINWDGPAENIAKIMARSNGYPLRSDIGYPTPGSLGMYAGVERKIPTITLELRAAASAELIRENLPALRAAIVHIADSETPKRKH